LPAAREQSDKTVSAQPEENQKGVWVRKHELMSRRRRRSQFIGHDDKLKTVNFQLLVN
jgi:hypothetical protein